MPPAVWAVKLERLVILRCNYGVNMNIVRYLKGKLTIHYRPWNQWNRISFEKYWSGRLFFLNISKIAICLDCRIDWLEDMITGKPR